MDDFAGQIRRQSKACKRCSRRKQRCHGFPVCSNCSQAGQPCEQSEFALSLHRHDRSSNVAFTRIRSLEAQLAEAQARLSKYEQGQTPTRADPSSPCSSQGSIGNTGRRTRPTPGETLAMEGGRTRSICAGELGLETPTPTAPSNAHLHSPSNHRPAALQSESPNLASPRSASDHDGRKGVKPNFPFATGLDEVVQATVWTKALSPIVNGNLLLPLSLQELRQRSAGPPLEEAGNQMLRAYFEKIHPRYPFIDRDEIANLHAQRLTLDATGPDNGFGIFKLYMVYAIGAGVLQLTGSHSELQPEAHFMAALQHMSAARQSHTVHNIEAMTLLVLYNLRSSFNSGIWYMTGLAMRTCNELGLHREYSYPSPPTYEGELKRRLFWSVYVLERVVASSLGRPLCIAEYDIDTQLPCDIDDFIRDDAVIAKARNDQRDRVKTSNLTMWIRFIRIKQFESHIRSEVYCLNQTKPRLLSKVEPILLSLEAWQANLHPLSEPETDYINLHCNKMVLLLLRPFLSMLQPQDRLIERCLVACGEICEIFKRMHQRDSYGHSFVSAHSTFIAGITMCYCLLLAPHLFSPTVSTYLRACSTTMFVVAERSPEKRKHRDILENIISRATMASGRASAAPTISSNHLSRQDLLAMQSLMDLSAHQDPPNIPTGNPHGANGCHNQSTAGPILGPMPTDASPQRPVAKEPSFFYQDTSTSENGQGRRLDRDVGFLDTYDDPDLHFTGTSLEAREYETEMLRELMFSNTAYEEML